MENVTNVLSTFSAWATSVVVIAGALTTVCKPVRNFAKWLFRRIYGNNTSDTVIKEIKSVEDNLSRKIDSVSEKCDDNERDRLQNIIFDFGNRARRKERISSEEFRFLQKSFKKYTELHGNDIAHGEYMFCEHYYNNQLWEEAQ